MKSYQAIAPSTAAVTVPPLTPLFDAAVESAEALLLYPLPPEFITDETASAGRPNSFDRDCMSLAVPPAGATTATAVAAMESEVNDDDTPWQARRHRGGGRRNGNKNKKTVENQKGLSD